MTPLTGVRVLDLTHALAGPFCTYHLGLLGADVLKLEPPGHGDDFRGFAPGTFAAVNGGKRSLAVDLKTAEGRAQMHALAAKADVLVENYRPDAAAKLGVDWPTLHAANPRLILCSITGFGAEGPRAMWPAVEWSMQAAAGISAMYLGDDADPREPGLPVLDVFSGANALTAILAALLERGRTGEGRRLEVTMADAALTLATPSLADQAAGKRGGPGPRPAVGRFRARDRRLFVMAAHPRWFATLAEVLGPPSLLEDDRFATPEARQANAGALLEAIEARLATRDAAEWQAELLARGMPAAAVTTMGELVATGYFDDAGMVHRDGEDRPVAGATLSGRTVTRAAGPAPALGEGGAAALRDWGVQ